MKVFLAFFLLIIVSFQVLPVKELGKILYQGLLTEEIHEADTDFPVKLKKLDEYRFDSSDKVFRTTYLASITHLTILQTENFLRQYIPDIITPPPNTI